MPQNHYISLQHISQTYHQEEILLDIKLSFTDNKITTLLGKSDSGKSTILQLINGILKPSKGEILVFEKKLTHLQANLIRLKMGYFVQFYFTPSPNNFSKISIAAFGTGVPGPKIAVTPCS